MGLTVKVPCFILKMLLNAILYEKMALFTNKVNKKLLFMSTSGMQGNKYSKFAKIFN